MLKRECDGMSCVHINDARITIFVGGCISVFGLVAGGFASAIYPLECGAGLTLRDSYCHRNCSCASTPAHYEWDASALLVLLGLASLVVVPLNFTARIFWCFCMSAAFIAALPPFHPTCGSALILFDGAVCLFEESLETCVVECGFYAATHVDADSRRAWMTNWGVVFTIGVLVAGVGAALVEKIERDARRKAAPATACDA